MPAVTTSRRLRLGAVVAAATLAAWLTRTGAALAAKSPLGIATPDATGPAFAGPLGGLFAWIATCQAQFYQALTHALSDIEHSGHAALVLVGLSFLYGVFHAVGPGHGKAVITSYLLASRQTVRRGIVISLAAAAMQGAVAIAIVLVAAVLLRLTAVGMTRATDWLEIISYALAAAFGAWLLWAKLTGHGHHAHDGAAAAPCAHHHHAHHAHGEAGHSHAPDPRALAAPLTASRAWAATLAVGIRPCSGAIIVLVFALSQHLLLAGIGSVLAMSFGTFITVSVLAVAAVSAKDLALRIAGFDTIVTGRIMHAIEICGAAVVLLFGLTLLGGALAAGWPG